MNQIPGDSSRKKVSPVGRRKPVARVDGASRRSGEVTMDLSGAPQAHLNGTLLSHPGSEFAPLLGRRPGVDAGVMVRDVPDDLSGRRQVGVSLQVATGQEHVQDVGSGPRNEAVAPIVEGLAEAGGARSRFEDAAFGAEPKIGSQDRDRAGLGPVRRPDQSRMSVVRNVDPVVQGVAQVADPSLGLTHLKAGVENPPFIRAEVAVRVLEVEQVRRRGGDDASVPQSQAFELENPVGEDHRVVHSPVAVPILQDPDPAARRLPRWRVVGVVQHLGDEGSPLLVEDQVDRVSHVRFGGEDLNPDVAGVVKAGQRFLRRNRSCLGALATAGEEQQAGQEATPTHGR